MRGLAAWEGVSRRTLLTRLAALQPAVHLAFVPIVALVTADTAIPERETEGQELSCRKSGAGVGVPGVTFSFSFSVFLHLIVLLPLFSSVFPLPLSHYLSVFPSSSHSWSVFPSLCVTHVLCYYVSMFPSVSPCLLLVCFSLSLPHGVSHLPWNQTLLPQSLGQRAPTWALLRHSFLTWGPKNHKKGV